MNGEIVKDVFRAALEQLFRERGAQSKCARLAGITTSSLNDIVKGRKQGSEETRRAIARALGKSYEELLNLGRETLGIERVVSVDEIGSEFDYVRRVKAQLGLGGSFITDGATSWQHYHDRTSLTKDSAPKGYFIVFREIGTIIIPMIESGVMVSDKVLPDISVGISWAGHWDANNLEAKYGPSIRCEHDYPDYYPQAKSNPQNPRAYPNAALGEFRAWLEDNYLATQFPRYISRQFKQGKVSKLTAAGAIAALAPKILPQKQ